MGENLLPIETVMARVHVKRSTIYKLIARGEFPAPVKIGAASRWPASKVDAWIAERVCESEGATSGA